VTHIAFFGHNVGDAAVRRRANAFMRAGHEVTGYMMRRGEPQTPGWKNHDLGQSFDNAYLHRLRAIKNGAALALRHMEDLHKADLIYARNLDMLACAQLVRLRAGLTQPLVFECLDVHKRLTTPGLTARALRKLERYLLRRCNLVVCSSPAFFHSYFEQHHKGFYRPYLLENRFIEGDAFPDRPSRPDMNPMPNGILRIGWFGNLRCRRSLELMKLIASRFPDNVAIVLRGYPAPNVFPDFEREIAPYPSIRFGGRYQSPEDLQALYGGVDIQWAGDFHEAGANSVWLLPNRLYEGGYFATPLICPAATETARWIGDNGGGFTVAEPIESALPDLIERLLQNPELLVAQAQKLVSLDKSHFVESPDETDRLIEAALTTSNPVDR
jgi:succinoglycan biosynthesis protein ExoL